MHLKFKQPKMILKTLLFSLGLIMSCNVFALKPIFKTYATEEDLDTEISERIAADAEEAEARLARDIALAAEVEAEKRARQTADTAETTARTNADQNLRQQILSIPSPPKGLETGDMQYWNGSAWELIEVPQPRLGRTLVLCGNVPQWSLFVGDEGEAGGIIFYVDETLCHGLEAATHDIGQFQWGCNFVDIGEVGHGNINVGEANTAEIIEDCTETPIAASEAAAYTQNGYDDYYLPAESELSGLRANRHVVPGLDDEFYWSSTEHDDRTAHYELFPDGSGFGRPVGGKELEYQVRPIRKF